MHRGQGTTERMLIRMKKRGAYVLFIVYLMIVLLVKMIY